MSYSTFSDYINLTIKFLDNKIYNTPWYSGELDEETNDLKDVLKDINRLGFLTISGQPGTYIKTDKYEELQRGYLDGFIYKDNIHSLMYSKDIVIYYYDYINKKVNIYPKNITNNNFFRDDYIILTQDRMLNEKNWRYYTTFQYKKLEETAIELLEMIKDENAIKNFEKNVYYIMVIMKKQNKLGLEKSIKKLLQYV